LTNPSPAGILATVKLPGALAKTTAGFAAQNGVSFFLFFEEGLSPEVRITPRGVALIGAPA